MSVPALGAELGAAVAEVEAQTSVELIVLVAPRSGTYPETAWLGGLVGLYLAFAAVMFLDAELGDSLIFTAPLAGLFAGAILVAMSPGLQRLLASRAAIERNLELVARATFQKAGLAATRDATALLVYLSWLERRAYIVADRGVTRALAPPVLAKLESDFTATLRAAAPRSAILGATRSLGPLLAAALPPRADDINELPDVIDVAF